MRSREDAGGRFKICILEVMPRLALTETLSVDSVFVFEKRYEGDSLGGTWSYISAGPNLLVKRESRDSTGHTVLREELIRFNRR